MLRFDKATYVQVLYLKFVSFERLSNSLRVLDVLLFLEFINIVSISYYTFIELHCCILFSNVFAQYKEYMVYILKIFNKFSNVLPAFTCTKAIGNL